MRFYIQSCQKDLKTIGIFRYVVGSFWSEDVRGAQTRNYAVPRYPGSVYSVVSFRPFGEVR